MLSSFLARIREPSSLDSRPSLPPSLPPLLPGAKIQDSISPREDQAIGGALEEELGVARKAEGKEGGREGGVDTHLFLGLKLTFVFTLLKFPTHPSLPPPLPPSLLPSLLQENVEGRHARFDQHMTGMQALLTPTQRARLVLWVTK